MDQQSEAPKKIVLIVDDDRYIRDLYAGTLNENYQILTAPTGKEGWMLTLRVHPDLILLDIMLPGGMNGFDILEQLKRDPKLSSTPVIVLTNLDSEERVARTIGVKDYFVKASTPIEKIVARVKEILSAKPVSTA